MTLDMYDWTAQSKTPPYSIHVANAAPVLPTKVT